MNEQQTEQLIQQLTELADAHHQLAKALGVIAHEGLKICFVDDLELSGEIMTQLRTGQFPLYINLTNNADCENSYPLQIQIKE